MYPDEDKWRYTSGKSGRATPATNQQQAATCPTCKGEGSVMGDCLDSPNIWLDPCPTCRPEEAEEKRKRIEAKEKQQAAGEIVTEKEVREARPFLVLPEGPQSIPFRCDSLIRLLDTVQQMAKLLEEPCDCTMAFYSGPSGYKETEITCKSCQRKAATLRRYRGEGE